METINLRLTFNVSISVDDANAADDIKNSLENLAYEAIAPDALIWESGARLKAHEITVQEIPEPLSMEEAESYFTSAMEQGDIDLSDLDETVKKLTRYGQQSDIDFTNEIRERLAGISNV